MLSTRYKIVPYTSSRHQGVGSEVFLIVSRFWEAPSLPYSLSIGGGDLAIRAEIIYRVYLMQMRISSIATRSFIGGL